MSEMNCRWIASDQPRVMVGRHDENCASEECRGCQPCTEPHCGICRRTHADGTCAECLTTVRDDLHEIARLCGSLPEEVEHRGINGEAMMLLGPVANPEAWSNRALSAMRGRVDDSYLDDCRDEQHPVWVLGTWEQAWRDQLEHDTDQPLTLTTAVSYLDLQMSYMAGREEPPFEDFARDLRGCRGHLEDVLRDGVREEKGAPCPACLEADERALPLLQVRNDADTTGASDEWVCRRNREHTWTEARYRLRVADDYRANADALTAPDIEAEYEVPAGTVRGWATLRPSEERARVRKRGKDESGRQLYDVADVLAWRDRKASA